MRARAKSESRVQPYHDGMRVRGCFGGARTNPKPAPEAQRFPAHEPSAFPDLVANGSHPSGSRDMRSQCGREPIQILCRVAGFLKQGAHQRIAPQPYLARHWLEHGFVAAIDECNGTRADFEQGGFDRLGTQRCQRKFDFIERHRCNILGACLSVPRLVEYSDRLPMLLQPQSSLEIMNVRSALLKSGMIEY